MACTSVCCKQVIEMKLHLLEFDVVDIMDFGRELMRE